jgi:hypothetical protein
LHNLRIHIAILLVLGLAKEETSGAAVVDAVQTPAGLAEEPAGDGATSSEETMPTGAGATSCETEKSSDADATSCETEKTVPAGAGDGLEQKPAGVEVDPSVDGASGTTPDEQETPTGYVADPNPKLSAADVEALEIYHQDHPKWGSEAAITHGRFVDKDIKQVVVFVRGTTDQQYDALLDFGIKTNGRTARKGPHPLLAMGDDRASGPSPPFDGRDELGNSGKYTFHYGARDIHTDTIVVKGQVLYICWILLDDCIAAPLILRSLV